MWRLVTYSGPVLTAILGLTRLFDPKGRTARVFSAVVIILSGVLSAYAIFANSYVESERARNAEAKYESAMHAIDRIGDAVDEALAQQKRQNREEQLTGRPTDPEVAQVTRTVLERAATELKSLRRVTPQPKPLGK